MTGPRLAIGVLAVIDGCVGAALALGDPLRTATPSYMTAKVIAPLEVWGWLLLTFGLLELLASALHTRLTPAHGRIALGVPSALAAGWHAFWAASFAATAVRDDRAALTGIAVYAGVAALHLIVAVVEEE